MSRIGEQPVKIEEGVNVKVEGRKITVTGPNGEIVLDLPELLNIEVKDGEAVLARKDDEKFSKSIHGTFRAILANAVVGVKEGFEKKLELVGVGYRAKMEGTTLVLSLGWNHPIKVETPEGVTIEVPDETKITIKGADKQKIGELAAKVRGMRKPEPYKGKGVRYAGEYVRRKSSKAGLAA